MKYIIYRLKILKSETFKRLENEVFCAIFSTPHDYQNLFFDFFSI